MDAAPLLMEIHGRLVPLLVGVEVDAHLHLVPLLVGGEVDAHLHLVGVEVEVFFLLMDAHHLAF